jgi:hypothetical protein
MSKKLFGLLLSGSMVLALSGCGGGGGGGDEPQIPNTEIESININNLYEGYEISGVNNLNEMITLLYCPDGHYEYYRNSESFTGDFNIVYDEIQMIDDNGGSYVIETGDNYLEVGEVYPCDSLGRDLEINSIVESNC